MHTWRVRFASRPSLGPYIFPTSRSIECGIALGPLLIVRFVSSSESGRLAERHAAASFRKAMTR